MKILPLNILKLLSIVIGFAMLSSCSSSNGTVSSFAARKYTKGYFKNTSGKASVVANRKSSFTQSKHVVEDCIKQVIELENPENQIKNLEVKLVKIHNAILKTPVTRVAIKEPDLERINSDTTKVASNTKQIGKIDEGEHSVGQVLIIVGGILFLFSLFFVIRGVSQWLLLGIGFFMLLFGLMYFFDSFKNNEEKNTVNDDTNAKADAQAFRKKAGVIGYTIEVIGLMAALAFYVLYNAIFAGSIAYATAISITSILAGASLVLAFGGFLECIYSLITHEKTQGHALAGIIIGVLAIVAAFVIFKI